MTNPCFHCADRHPVCHDTCERYKAWQEFHAAEVADKRRKNDACTIHKNDFDEEFWNGNPQRRRRRHRLATPRFSLRSS